MICVGRVDGLDVGQIGGSDIVIFQQVNLFVVQVNVSGEISEFFGQELIIREVGWYKYKGGMFVSGEVWDDNYIVGLDNDSCCIRNYMDEVVDYSYIVDLLVYKYMIIGKIDNFGEGKLFSVVEVYILLMCWSCVV